MHRHFSTFLALRLLSLNLSAIPASSWTTGTWTTGYWDCCKPSCSWPNKGNVDQPVPSCHASTGFPISNPNEASVCHGGNAGTCAEHQPFPINDRLSMGFAAAAVGGVSGLDGDTNCGQCFELQFTDQVHVDGQWTWGGAHPDLVGRTHIVQVTNIGYDVSGVHSFDLQIPGAGMGQFQAGCSRQYPSYAADAFDGGNHYGGYSSKNGCSNLPIELQRGCEWRFDWYKWLLSGGKTNNPYVRFRRVKCPTQLVAITGTTPTDDGNYPEVNLDDFGSGTTNTPPTTTDGGMTSTSPIVSTTIDDPRQCSQRGEDCRTSKCCSDGLLTCYEKNQWWASCKASCTPGIDQDDPPQHQTPWTCTSLEASTNAPSTTMAPSTTIAPSSTMEPTTTNAPPTTMAPSTLEPTTTRAPSSTVAPSTTLAPSSTMALSTLESTTTRAPSSTVAPSTTMAPSSTMEPTTTRAPSTCSGVDQDCRSSQCCSDPDLTCYMKNEWWAECKATCIPGVDPTDDIAFRTPWSCVALPLTGPTTVAPVCSASGTKEDCHTTQCCNNPDHTCYSKNQWWAECKASCTPGAIDPTDDVEFQTPWSCMELPLTATTTVGPMCSGVKDDCRTTQCCINPDHTCYSKNQWWAECKASCAPGEIDPTDPVEFQTPWSCAELPSTGSTTAAPTCSGVKEDCRTTQCCSNPGHTCYSKNQWWAECKASCTPGGIDPTDDIEFQTPWSCAELPLEGKGTTTPVPMCSGVKEDCRTTQCCSNSQHTCYSKNQWWAECNATCTPGIDFSEPVEFQTPWSCTALSNTGGRRLSHQLPQTTGGDEPEETGVVSLWV